MIKRFFLPLALSLSTCVYAEVCKIDYDAIGIPHVTTDSVKNQFYCMGLLHGKDRGWEMDFLGRVGRGRNAEVLGFSHLKGDLMMRLLDLPSRARALWEKFPEAQKRIIQSYSDGVNEGLKTGKAAKEFVDLDYVPEAWSPEDSLLVLLTQSFDQTRKTFFRDYQEEKAKADWGETATTLFDHDGLPWESAILKEGEYPKKAQAQKTVMNDAKAVKLWASFPTVFGEASGSNNWAISAKKSKTGRAILANDPHLDLKTPLFWYWIHLKSPEGEIIGGSLPGVPVIATGTNGKVAWGLTNSYINTADAIFLKDASDDDFESVRPTVWIKFGLLRLPFFFKSFKRMKSGHPILPLETESDLPMALRWTGFSLTPADVLPLFDFVNVKDVTEMNVILKRVGVPAWNFVFADTKGDIGYRMVGRAYRHLEKFPFGIPTQTLADFHREDYLDPEEIPHVLKPKRQYVYTANNRHFPTDAAFYGGRGYSHSFRALRIDELLQGTHDPESFKGIQCDRLVVDATFFVPKLLRYLKIEELEEWNMRSDDASSSLSLYRRLMDIMMEEWKVDEYALFRLLDKLGEDRSNELEKFLRRARLDVQDRPWGEFHRLGFTHLSNNEEWVFSPEVAGIGDNHTVDPGTSRWNDSKKVYEQYSGASMRMIIEMSDRPRIQLALPGLNRDYSSKSERTPWQDWRTCKYTEVSF